MYFNKHFKTLFESYVESIKHATMKNNMKTLTYACIALGPSGSLQGYQKVLDIYTGRLLKRRTINEVLMPEGCETHEQ